MQIVNINGTDADELAEQWAHVTRCARLLDSALAEATPHGRDYIPQGGGDFHLDREEHARMRSLVRQIADYSAKHHWNILEQEG